MHVIVKWFINGSFVLFVVGTSANAGGSKRTLAAVFGRRAVLFFVAAFLILVGLFVRLMHAFGLTGVVVIRRIENKAVIVRLVVPEDGMLFPHCTKPFGSAAILAHPQQHHKQIFGFTFGQPFYSFAWRTKSKSAGQLSFTRTILRSSLLNSGRK